MSMRQDSLAHKIEYEGCVHTRPISYVDDTIIEQSRAAFDELDSRGVIVSGEYESMCWRMYDGVHSPMLVDFSVDELAYKRKAETVLCCSSAVCKACMRVVITGQFGYSLSTLAKAARALKDFANSLSLPDDYDEAQVLLCLLMLLPGESDKRDRITEQLETIQLRNNGKAKRKLACYQSYFRFEDYLNNWWAQAIQKDKIKFFPVWLWWKLTSILPLRPTEFTLTPRNCIRWDDSGHAHITVRRTKQKGKAKSTRYSLEDDYELCEYRIPASHATEIERYVAATDAMYVESGDMLFCKNMQFQLFSVNSVCTGRYTRNNLQQCLQRFYGDVLIDHYGLTVVTNVDCLAIDEIELLNLGDTRHFAIISLVCSGASLSTCKALAGHADITVTAHYASNIETFLDVLAYEQHLKQPIKEMTVIPAERMIRTQPVQGGYCQSLNTAHGDFTDCSRTVDSYGHLGQCSLCVYYVPKADMLPVYKADTAKEMKITLGLLGRYLESLRSGVGCQERLEALLDRLHEQANQYCKYAVHQYSSSDERLIIDAEKC